MRCFIPQYFTQIANTGLALRYMPVNGTQLDGYSFESFLPFIIVGYAVNSGGTPPNGAPGSSTFYLGNNTENASFPNQLLGQSMMQANRDGQNASGFLRYSANTNGNDFSRYYKRSMQEPGLQDQNFGTFLMPAMLMEGFWSNMQSFEAGAMYDELVYNRFVDHVRNVFKSTDLRLWYPPGTYEMDGDTAVNNDPYFAAFKALFTDTADDLKGLIIAQIISIQ